MPARQPFPVRSLRPQRIAVVRALRLGDMLCAIPAVRALRHGFERANITLIGLPWAHELVERFPGYFDDFMEFPGHPGIPERPYSATRARDFFEAARAREFDLAIQMHGDGRLMNDFTRALGAGVVAGFHPADRPPPYPGRFLRYPEDEREVTRLLRLVEFLGRRACGTHLEFPVRPGDAAEAVSLLGAAIYGGRYVCVHPGSSTPLRRWSAEAFAAVADALAERGNVVVLTGGPGERDVTAEVRERMCWPALDLAGRTSLGGLAALIERARLLVANDTGAAHLAAALGTPSVVVFTGSDPARWAALDAERHRAVVATNGHAPDDGDAPDDGYAPDDAAPLDGIPARVVGEALELLGARR